MNGMVVLLVAGIWFLGAYLLYGRFLVRLFGIDSRRPTPAQTRQDGLDYVPTRFPVLFGHHFASIAGAGPIVGPVAAIYLGWFPTLMWIVLGCVFVGAMHDFAAFFLSVRDEGRSIGHVIEQQLGYAGRQIFLLFSWAALVLVVTIFAILVAKTFASTPAVATASLLFIAMAPVFGYLVNRKGMSIVRGSLIFVPLLFVFVWVGTLIPADLVGLFDRAAERNESTVLSEGAIDAGITTLRQDLVAGGSADAVAAALKTRLASSPRVSIAALRVELSQVLAPAAGEDIRRTADTAAACVAAARAFLASERARNVWLFVLLIYVFIASVLPVWMLLQPRDYLNSYLLYAMMALGFAGILVAMPTLKIPAFSGWVVANSKGKPTAIFPMLFVTVACGACSGFHALVASGTSAKQIADENHILPIGYGGMLVEGVLAVMALISVGYLTRGDYDALINSKGNVAAFASGLATFCTRLGLPLATGRTFIALTISAFMLTTLDTATRLTRFAWQELFLPRSGQSEAASPRPAWRVAAHPFTATAIAVLAAGYLALSGDGMTIWPVFGASNQLLAALTLLAVTLYLIRRRANYWVALLPMIFMIVISGWALVILLIANLGTSIPLVVATVFLLVMALVLAVLAVKSLLAAGGRESAHVG